ncbi:MAG: hypothetical protein LUQ31_07875 [Methanoregula sp.]|nr:hypothetical protein [Methanoregula sp.]
MAAIPMVSAAQTTDDSVLVSNATADQVEKINELWGSDITIGEYMEQVHPEHLAGIPDDVKNEMYQRKMDWPDEESHNSISALPNQVNSILATLTVTGSSTAYSNRVEFRSSATCSQAASYIYVESFLKNAADTTVGSSSASSHDYISTISCSNMVSWPPAGYYHVHSWGYTITPSSEGSHHDNNPSYFSG